jgi:hypothetical protein
MPKDYAALAKKAADLTNKQLASDITDLTVMTTRDLMDYLPQKRDKQDFIELMRVVQSETDEDRAIAKVTGDIARFGKVIVRVFKFFA